MFPLGYVANKKMKNENYVRSPPPLPFVILRPSRMGQLANRGENDIWRAFGAVAERSPSRDSVSGAAGAAAAAAGAAGASFDPAASPPGLAVGAVAHADAGGGASRPAAGASSPPNVATSPDGGPRAVQGATEEHLNYPVLENLLKALPPGLARLSTREWVSKAAAAGRLDFLEVRWGGRT